MILPEQMQLYAITDTNWLNGRDFIEVVEDVLRNGATFLQLREKNATHEEIVKKAKLIKPVAARYGVPFVINDDVEAAKEADADGVHIGQSDMDYERARAILGSSKIIGMTAKTIEQAREAERLGADYIGTGAVFGSTTKMDAKFMPKELLVEIVKSVNIPVVAIGGINYDNCDYLEHTGVDGIAVVSAIFAADNPGKATEELYIKTARLFGKPRNIIFDMDGTIVDSMGYWRGAAREYVMTQIRDTTGLPEDFDDRIVLMSISEVADYYRTVLNIPVTDSNLWNRAIEIMIKHYRDDIQAKTGMLEFIRREKNIGTKMSIFTNSPHECVETVMGKLGILDCFDSIFTPEEITGSKTDPDSFRIVLEKTGFHPKNTWVYEDNGLNMKAAKACGLKVGAVYDSNSVSDWNEVKRIADVSRYIV